MGHRIYLDTHMIDYLWDHRSLIWESKAGSLRRARVKDSSSQIKEYEALEAFPEVCYFNDWRLVVGERVIDELRRVGNRHRRESLLEYASQLDALTAVDPDDLEDQMDGGEEEISPDPCPAHPPQLTLPGFEDCYCLLEHAYCRYDLTQQLIERLPSSDRPLVREAIELSCDVFLTTDAQLLKRGEDLERAQKIRIRSITGLLNETIGPGGCCTRHPPTYYPDVLLYTGMMPGNHY